MNYIVTRGKGTICAEVNLPASKSISNRALILNALCRNPGPIHNLSDSDDTKVLLSVLEELFPHTPARGDFNIGAAGTSMRFLTAFLAQLSGRWTLTGSQRMQQRPIGLLAEALNGLGGRVAYLGKEGFPPLDITGGPVQGGEVTIPGDVSSQYLSALLMIAPKMEKGLTIHLEGEVVSKPYIRQTLKLMETFGVETAWDNSHSIAVKPQTYRAPAEGYTVEPDWSSASYWYQIAALSPEAQVVLPGLQASHLQGDEAAAELFTQLGLDTTYTHRGAVVKNHSRNAGQRLEYNFVDQPDLAQTFVVGCVLLNVPFRFTGLQSLRIKETDRIEALRNELAKLGYLLKETHPAALEWNGERCEPQPHPVICTYEDHRMAMAFAPAALKYDRGIRIANPQVVSKSYPGFWSDLQRAGFTVTKESIN